jgi:5-methyltetrahydropteroyltriglutamate--homocysteine methyltransferase
MTLPTESIGSMPRPTALLEGIEQFRLGKLTQAKLYTLYEDALKDTMARLEARPDHQSFPTVNKPNRVSLL